MVRVLNCVAHIILFHRSIAVSPRYLCRSLSEPLISRQLFLGLSSSGQMGSGKNGVKPVHVGAENGFSHSRSQYSQEVIMVGSVPIYPSGQPVSQDAYEQNPSASTNDSSSHAKTIEEGRKSASISRVKSKQPKSRSVPDSNHEHEYPPLAASSGSSSKKRQFSERSAWIDLRSVKETEDVCSSKPESLSIAYFTGQGDDSSLPTCFGKKRMPTQGKRTHSGQTNFKHEADIKNFDPSKGLLKFEPFDICWSKSEIEHTVEGTSQRILRPGMVLLKHYITLSEQIKIVKSCRELGLGPGGFYQPGYQDGAKLRLQMMCLGLNWDPETKYENQHRVDGSEPPGIPHEFILLVKNAIDDAHALIKKDSVLNNVEGILPAMSPNICIVNFYTTSGRLGLHKDRDESRESLRKGLPVVSFSVGDSAEFLYGDQRDVDKAEKVVLESGDVLIFGGKSRHIFHGVSSIIPNSAPRVLLEEARLRPGRLNLTFRQF